MPRTQCRRKLRSPRWRLTNSHPGPDVATNLLAQIERLWANLRGLGVRRLSALALIGVTVFATTGLAGYYLSRPTMETLYSGLDRDDISAIGAALLSGGEAGELEVAAYLVVEHDVVESLRAHAVAFGSGLTAAISAACHSPTRARASARMVSAMR